MNKVGISPDQYQMVNLPSDVELFASGDVPIWSGYINIFALEVQRAGYDINMIFPDDYGIHFYGNILITTDDLIAKDAGLVQRFLRATLRGWTYAVENPNAASAFVQQYNPEADTALEEARMAASIPLVNTGEDFIGWMKPEVWEAMEQTLREQGILTTPLRLEDVYTMQFIEEIYKR
jgi:ABC-type nitrate/sulfonate/bicarbonate transport system substrate-binding protein